MTKKVSIEVEIKNIKKVADLKKELKALRKEQTENETYAKKGLFTSKKQEKQYIASKKAVKEKSAQLRMLNKNLSTSNKETLKVTKSSNGLAKQFVKGAAAIGIIVTAFRMVSKVVSSVVSTFSEFQFVMAKVQAVSGATDEEFKKLTQSAEDLGRTTFFTASQVGELQLNYSKLGFTANEILAAQKATLDLATATGTDLARAATVAGAAVRGFGLDASETERVVDVMAVSFASSAMSIEKWQTSMTKVAPIAKAAGFSIEDTAAIMSKLTDSGIEASIAGTSLRNILLKMQDPTSELSMRFGRTIHSLDDLVPAMKQFVAEGGSMADVMEVVDLRQAAAFEQMLTTADGTLKLRDSLLAANGEGARMAEIVGDTMQGAFLKLKSALEGVSISVMKGFAEGIQSAVENLATFFNFIAKNSKVIIGFVKLITIVGKAFVVFKASVLATNIAIKLNTKFLALQRLAAMKGVTATNFLTLSFTKLKLAINGLTASTGIGLFITLLSFVVPWLMKTNDELEIEAGLVEKLTDDYYKSIVPIEKMKITSQELIRVKGLMNAMIDKEGNLLEDTLVNQKIYNKLKGQASIHTRILNSDLEKTNSELLTEKSSINDVTTAIGELTQKMTEQALVKGFNKQIEKITEDAANATIALAKIADEFGVDPDKVKDLFDINGEIKQKVIAPYQENAEELKASNNALLISFMSMGDILESSGFDSLEDLNKALSSTDKNTQLVIKAFNDLAGGDIMTLFDKFNKKTDVISKNIFDWGIITKETLNNIKKNLVNGAIDQEEYSRLVLDAKKLLLEKELSLIEDNVTNRKRLAELNAKLLSVEMQIRKDNQKQELQIAQETYQKKLDLIKSENTVNGKLTETGRRKELEAEAILLQEKARIHNEYKDKLLNINSQIAANNLALHQQTIREIKEQAGAMSGIGGALQALAGDNEKLNKVKEAGIKISQAASIVEAFLTLQTNLQTIAKTKGGIASLFKAKSSLAEATATTIDTTATTANTVVETASIIPKVASGAAGQTKLPFPLNIIAVIATLALLSKIMGKFEEGGIVEGGKKFANGGMVNGKSHAQGGEKFAVGGRVAELEGGEAVINKRSTAMFKNQLSEMNAAGGGVKFADGGLMNMPSFATSQFDAVGQQNMMGAMNQTNKVVVVESDITTSQNTVGLIEAEATF